MWEIRRTSNGGVAFVHRATARQFTRQRAAGHLSLNGGVNNRGRVLAITTPTK
jgi:hypothetical protein